MISFKHGKPEKTNASVTFGENTVKSFSERDPDGNIIITFDIDLEPDDGESVFIVLHSENNSEYRGEVHRNGKGDLIFIATNITPEH